MNRRNLLKILISALTFLGFPFRRKAVAGDGMFFRGHRIVWCRNKLILMYSGNVTKAELVKMMRAALERQRAQYGQAPIRLADARSPADDQNHT